MLAVDTRETGPIQAISGVATRRWRSLTIIANLVFWLVNGVHELVVRGLFLDLGVDWARFWGAARAFNTIAPSAAYQLPEIASFMQPLVRYARPATAGVRVGPAPYPPIFLEFFGLFTISSPRVGFFLWTALSVGLALVVFHRLAQRFHPASRWPVTLVLLSSFPLMMAFFVGQVVVLLLVCIMQAVTEFERGREFRAGLWTGLLVLKPQYAFCFVLIYAFKRRASALAGFVSGAAMIGLGSFAVGGFGGLIGYARMLVTNYPAYAGGTAIDPRGMIGWRATVLTFLPNLSTHASLALVAGLSMLTVAALPLIWRGPWDPASDRFASQLAATFAVTLLVAYHSQPHGATLLLVPCSLVIARETGHAGIRRLMIAAVGLAPVLGLISVIAVGNLSFVSMAITGVLIALLATYASSEAAERFTGKLSVRSAISGARRTTKPGGGFNARLHNPGNINRLPELRRIRHQSLARSADASSPPRRRP